MISKLSQRTFVAALLSFSIFTLSSAAAPAGVLDSTHDNVRDAIAVQKTVSPGLMRESGILGTAIGVNPGGQVSLVIYVDEKGKNAAAQATGLRGVGQIRGIPVHVELTEQFRAPMPVPMGKPARAGAGGAAVSHTAIQTPPIQLGTSGGWESDSANGYCCAGTLGSLVQVNGVQFILSNYHVLEADIVSGGNNTIAVTGNPVIQPGLIDIACNAANSQTVATLKVVHSLPTYNVDVGLAEAAPGMVSALILEIGTISSQTATAAINQAVKKSGRTSGLTRSKVVGLNATISVTYDNECAGGAAFTKTFTGQIVISNRASKFLKGGDSGSLMVQDVSMNPRAVGLLYAGSSSYAIANPIDEVLTFVGTAVGGAGTVATMVGN